MLVATGAHAVTRTLSPCYETNRESRGTHSCFLLRDASAPSQHMTASHLHRSPCANRPSALGPRVAHGTAVQVRSPRGPGSVSCHAILTDEKASCLLVDGHGRGWPDLRAPSLVCSEYSRRLSRSHPLSGGLSLPLLLPAVPPRSRAPLPAAVSRRASR